MEIIAALIAVAAVAAGIIIVIKEEDDYANIQFETLDDVMSRLPPERRESIERRAAELSLSMQREREKAEREAD